MYKRQALILTAEQTGLGTATATGIAFLITALWWIGCSLPLLKNYRQIHFVPRAPGAVKNSLRRLGRTLRDIRKEKKVFWFLLAFFFYIDGVYTCLLYTSSFNFAYRILTFYDGPSHALRLSPLIHVAVRTPEILLCLLYTSNDFFLPIFLYFPSNLSKIISSLDDHIIAINILALSKRNMQTK